MTAIELDKLFKERDPNDPIPELTEEQLQAIEKLADQYYQSLNP
jgi:hypothetical protein